MIKKCLKCDLSRECSLKQIIEGRDCDKFKPRPDLNIKPQRRKGIKELCRNLKKTPSSQC